MGKVPRSSHLQRTNSFCEERIAISLVVLGSSSSGRGNQNNPPSVLDLESLPKDRYFYHKMNLCTDSTIDYPNPFSGTILVVILQIKLKVQLLTILTILLWVRHLGKVLLDGSSVPQGIDCSYLGVNSVSRQFYLVWRSQDSFLHRSGPMEGEVTE